ncbi:MAG: Uncharacterized protein G01um101418_729 [Parcubacteria group bacterium Gr01-1014_18]|nr:MAG: Uncharacterized protein Greene041636_719 [Parcubacteria group bacterium Greene0416_36]TSC80221.1 MAG: Uncharacterized protein G01um101418_729 [Parcubacteria group bacterium Gr01-1014_18]TSC98403.1 MAG: Uncharacterized protein Greene101420_756 [Parcubacteria group bacterium Greene1014_20]TSD06944.1 MAG: Uncharacterized protein Greene07142_507 [Parcubacteria group bacterium Greene0714_2]
MQKTEIQSVTEFEHFLNRLSEDDLRLLNRMVVERLKLYHKVRDLKNLAQFNVMDRVCFNSEGRQIVGIVIKLNRRSVTLRADDGHQWNVSPALLMRR